MEKIMTFTHKINRKKLTDAVIFHIILIAVSLIFLLPFFYMIFMSVMTNLESVGNPKTIFFPRTWNWSNYAKAIDKDFLNWTVNTLIVIGVDIIAIPLSASFCAFGFTRVKFAGRDKIFAFVLSTMMLPSIIVQVPLYVIFVKINWKNTLLPLTVPAFLGGGAITIFLIKQFMRSIPISLDEAATIDGANKFSIYFSIVLPLCKPILLFVMINTFMAGWNDFSGPLMYLRHKDCYTLALGVYYKYAGKLSESNFPNLQMATGAIMVIPSAIIFFLFQRQLIDGVNIGSIKG